MKVELDILWLETEETELQRLGIDPPNEADFKPVTFYSIDSISDYTHKEQPSSLIQSGGQEYITALPYIVVKELIESQLKS